MADQTDIISRTTVKVTANTDQDPVSIMHKPVDHYCLHMMTPTTTVKSLLAQRGPPNSLNRLISNRGSLKAVHASFVRDMESHLRQNKKNEVSQEEIDYGYGDAAPGNDYGDSTDYGYGDASPSEPSNNKNDAFEPQNLNPKAEEPDAKRRRYQRRNSKTPAMLLAMNSPLLLHLDFLEDQNGQQNASLTGSPPSSGSGILPKDIWDGGIEIAEELFKHLQKRRQSQT